MAVRGNGRGRRRAHGGAPPPIHGDARESSSSLPAMDVAGGERTGGAPPPRNGARRAAGQRGREREQTHGCSQRGSRRREGGAAPARTSATAGAVRRGDEIGQPDGVGVIVGVILGKNGEMGTTVPRRGYIYPAH